MKDVLRCYKDFTTAQIDTIEILLMRLYTEWGITEETDFSQMKSEDYPILSELYDYIEIEYLNFDEQKPQLYTKEMLQQVLLGLYSMCKGADAKFFNGHSNLTSTRFLVFGVKGLNEVAANVRSTILLNLLSYMTDKLLIEGNTVAALDELYIWLGNPVAVEYIRNALKRVRKKNSAMLMASQNVEDFDRPGVREMTKPLFSIPPHQFLFNCGTVNKRSSWICSSWRKASSTLFRPRTRASASINAATNAMTCSSQHRPTRKAVRKGRRKITDEKENV